MAPKAGKKKTLAQELAELTSTAPTSFDPEQEGYGDGTDALLRSYDDEDGDNGSLNGDDDLSSMSARPSLRMTADMESLGHEYASKRVARKDLASAGDDAASSSGSGSGSEEADDDDEDEQDGANRTVLQDSSSSEDEQSENEQQQAAEDTDSEDDDDDELSSARQSSVFATLDSAAVDSFVDAEIDKLTAQDAAARVARAASTQTEHARAAEALRQRQWWDSALEVRILLQRLLDLAATAPAPQHLPLYTAADPELRGALDKAAAAADSLARDLSTVRKGHMRQTCVPAAAAAAAAGDAEQQQQQLAAVQDGASSEEVWADAAADYELCKGWWVKTVDRCVCYYCVSTASTSIAAVTASITVMLMYM
jgi:protein AATF/BFR2